MLILLPPSEGKAEPRRRGTPVDPASLGSPGLAETRAAVLAATVKLGAHAASSPEGLAEALARLDAGASLAGVVTRNADLERLPAAAAHSVYTGVLFDALGWGSLAPEARRFGASRVLVVSALWGLVRPNDRIPPYRLSMDSDLPGTGPLAGLWRRVLPGAIEAAAGSRGVVVDCRSGPYVAAAPLTGPLAARSVQVRVLREDDGRRTVVSHLAKHTRGEVTRLLLERRASPNRPQQLADVLAERWPVELTPGRPGRPSTLDVVLSA